MANVNVSVKGDRAGGVFLFGGNATSAANCLYPEHISVSKKRQTADKQSRWMR